VDLLGHCRPKSGVHETRRGRRLCRSQRRLRRDGIPNRIEGCPTGRDSDKDGIPDWQDSDSDNDKVLDYYEKGEKNAAGKCKNPIKPGSMDWPCDSDGYRLPDYLDTDSDNDRLDDGLEDYNGDGLVGCCLSKYKITGSAYQNNCKLTTDVCGNGQTCVNGNCTPAVTFRCSEGETDPRRKDTFDDGRLDIERGTFICRDATEDRPKARRIRFRVHPRFLYVDRTLRPFRTSRFCRVWPRRCRRPPWR
jgi:hypothetical protein